ncbi:hypothetical protein B7486_72670, partial [cyanobacterium TDX16]
ADSSWKIEEDNNVFSGAASEGTMETFRRVNTSGIDHVAYDFECEGTRYSGNAQLLAPEDNRQPGQATIRIESREAPVRA